MGLRIFGITLMIVLWPLLASAAALHDAASKGDLAQIQRLLDQDQDVDVSQTDAYGFTPLLIADLNHHDDVVQLLKAKGAQDGLTALVNRLQFYLAYLGFQPGPQDGELGGATRRAIRQFQAQAGFKPNGRVAQSWVAALQRDMLAKLQSQLQQLGFYAGTIDGVNSSVSHDAISAYQAQAGLPVSGTIAQDWVLHLQQSLAALTQPTPTEAIVAEIRQLQITLTALGFDTNATDGQLGPATTNAIRAFQQQHKLTPSGLSDAEFQQRLERELVRTTQKHLHSLGYRLGAADGKPGANTAAAIRAYQEKSQLAITSKASGELLQTLETRVAAQTARKKTQPLTREQLQQIQTQLRKLGYQPGSVDGRGGEKTTQAIRAYQEKTGLAVTGDADTALLTHLQTTITTAATREAQTRLKALGYYRGRIDGTLGPNTNKAIGEFQRQQQLPVTGKLDDALLARLNTTATPPTTSLSATEIKVLQHQLNRLGYAVGKADGQFGSRTEKAIRRYQKSQGMAVTGQASAQLLAQLSGTSERVSQSRRVSAGGRKTSGGNTEVQGRLRLQRSGSGALLGCAIQGIQLDRAWCDPFATRRDTGNCKVVLRPNSAVLMVTCR